MSFSRADRMRHVILSLSVSIASSFLGPQLHAQCSNPVPSRPILFVHGFNDNSTSWGDPMVSSSLRGSLILQLQPTPGYSNQSNYDLYFDGNLVRQHFPGGDPVTDPIASIANIPCNARFFSIDFYSWTDPSDAFNALDVANISVITKAYELSQVIKTITALTYVQDVIVVAHSMGAMDARAYLEDLGSTYAPCTVDAYPCNKSGSLLYSGDIAHLITLDGVNGGAAGLAFLANLAFGLIGVNSLNVTELGTNSNLVNALNYNGQSFGGAWAQPLPSGFAVDAIMSLEDPLPDLPCALGIGLCQSDRVVPSDSQSIQSPLASAQSTATLTDYSNPLYGVEESLDSHCYLNIVSILNVPILSVYALHLLQCLGDQQATRDLVYQRIAPYTTGQFTQVTIEVNGNTYQGPISLVVTGPNGNTQVNKVPAVLSGPFAPLGSYSVAYQSGGPAPGVSPTVLLTDAAGNTFVQGTISLVIGPGNWSLKFDVSFPAGPPTVTTFVPGAPTGDGATLNGTVIPNGALTTAWMEWSSDGGFSQFTSTSPQSVGSGTSAVPVSVGLSGLASGLTYYYRLAATNGGSTIRGSPQNFTTLGTLPAPTPLSPLTAGASQTPDFSWSVIGPAASYRLVVATDSDSLPTNPTSPNCTSGCVLNVTPAGPGYVPPAGVLAPSTVYYWRVHARGATQFGDWSDIASFTTGPGVALVNFTVSSVNSGSPATGNVYLSGMAGSGGLAITVTAAPESALQIVSPVTVSPGSSSVSFSAVAQSVSQPALVVVTASVNGGSQSTVLTVTPTNTAVLPSSLSFSPTGVVGGSSVSGTVTLSAPAPTGGVFTFTSSPSGLIQFPSVTVAAGSSSQTFTATTSAVTISTPITVTASYGGASTQGSLTLTRPGGSVVLSSLAISPSTVVGGASALGIVTFTGPAPSGATVALSDNNTHYAQIPASNSVTATPGYNTVTFPITTTFTTATAGITIAASYNNTAYGASLTVLPLAVTEVSFSPMSVTSGGSAPFTVYLNGPAPAGASISLLSSSPSALQVISSVPVLTGATSVSVNATALNVTAQTTVSVTASYNSSSAQGSVSVIPLLLDWLSLSQYTVTGGTSVTGTVQLSGNAPAGGVNVMVSSSSPSLTPLTSPVNVAAGSATATFTIPTSAVAALTGITLTASYGAISDTAVLTLVPPLPFLQSMTISPGTVNGGSQATGTVTLTAPAPVSGSTGASVILTTSFYAIAGVGNLVYVQPGATTATFPINTAASNFIEAVTITGTYNGITLTQVLNVVPAGTPLAPSSLTLSPLMLTGGGSATATVGLTGPAPTGGVTLTITSDNPAIQVAGQITIPAGSTVASFKVATSSVTAITTATITVSCNGISRSSLLTVRPAAAPARNPSPFLTSPLSPESQAPGTARKLSIHGAGFVSGATAYWNGTPLSTTFTNGTQMQASVPASLGQLGSAEVSVANPGAGSARSNPLPAHTTFPQTTLAFGSSTIAAPSSAGILATGDFNGDSIPDVVIGDGIQSAWVYLGNGDGTFSGPLILPAGAPTGVVVADFNGDGKLDLGFVNGAAIRIFLGNGDGTFTQIPDTPLPAVPGQQSTLAAGDFNGDGAVDLAVTGNSINTAYVLLGNGDGTFGTAAAVGSLGCAQGLAIGDFNGDGKLDLVLTDCSNHSVAVLLGNGNGTFQAQHEYPTNGTAVAVAVADFNGDGHADIAVANAGPCCGAGAGAAVLLNDGTGAFLAPSINGPGQNYYGLSTEDVDGDGKTDLVALVYQPATALLVFHGNGDGTFATTPFSIPISNETAFFGIADLNDDGAPDMLVATVSGTLNIMLQTISSVLQVAPGSLTATATQGSQSPAPPTLTISNPGGGTLNWTATISTQTWGALSQTSGVAPSTLNLIIDTSGLAAGTYIASITITGSGSNPLSQTVAVSLTVTAPPIVLASLTFDSTAFVGPRSLTGTVTLSAAVGSPLTVALVSSDPSVQVPMGVPITAGQSSGTFAATASTVTVQTGVTVTASYGGGQATSTLTVSPPMSQTITFNGLPSQLLGTAPLTVSATASSGLAVSFNSQTTGVCTVSGATVTLVATGTCTIQATQPGYGSYSAAMPVSQSFSVFSPCDLKQSGNIGVSDVQLIINEALGVAPAVNFLAGNSVVNVVDVQIEINAALGLGCTAK